MPSKKYPIPKEAFLIDIDQIKPLQTKLSRKKLMVVKHWLKKDTKFHITVYKLKDEYYIWNGHHRLYSAYELGIKQVYIKIIKNKKPNDVKKVFRRQELGYEHISQLEILEHEEFLKYMKK